MSKPNLHQDTKLPLVEKKWLRKAKDIREKIYRIMVENGLVFWQGENGHVYIVDKKDLDKELLFDAIKWDVGRWKK